MQKTIIVGLQLILAFVFVVDKSGLSPPINQFFSNYFADIFIPFAFYYLLLLVKPPPPLLNRWWGRAGVVFMLCTASEILQYFGIFALARVYDPWDLFMYGLGVDPSSHHRQTFISTQVRLLELSLREFGEINHHQPRQSSPPTITGYLSTVTV